jgi:hypothetical protein
MGCIGILGRVLGHNMKAVYDIDEEKLTSQEVNEILMTISKYNYWSLHTNSIQPDLYGVKRVTKVYRAHVCSRCGYKIVDKTEI